MSIVEALRAKYAAYSPGGNSSVAQPGINVQEIRELWDIAYGLERHCEAMWQLLKDEDELSGTGRTTEVRMAYEKWKQEAINEIDR